MRFDSVLEASAAHYGAKTAVQFLNGGSVSFSDLHDQVESLARCFRGIGLEHGDRAIIASKPGVDSILVFWAILRAGGVAVFLNDDAREEDVRFVLQNASPTLVYCQSAQREKLEDIARTQPFTIVDAEQVSTWSSDDFHSVPTFQNSDDPAVIVYTSGSSGRPKGVCLSHKNLWTVVQSVVRHMPISDQDSYLMVVPLHYVHGLMQLLVHAHAGATVYFLTSFVFPKKVVEAIQETRVTGFSGVPFHFNALLSRGGFLDAKLPHLKWMTVTGGKLPASVTKQILEHHPSVNFHIAYGQTECAPRATALDPSKLLAKPDSVGSPIPDVAVVLLDDQGKEVARGDVGEVVVVGENVMLGYWQDPDATAMVKDEEGRLHTGDLGYFDDDGDLFLVGRTSEMIKSAGERIIPEEIERVIVEHPFIEDAVVVGVEDVLYGQRVVAHMLSTDDCESCDDEAIIAEVRRLCLESIPFARAPREYHRWIEFPRKPNGKPDRRKIGEKHD